MLKGTWHYLLRGDAIMAAWTIKQYDYFHTDGLDILCGKHLKSRDEAIKKLYELFPDSKIEEEIEEEYKYTPEGTFIVYHKYYIGHYTDMVEGAKLKVEKI